MRAERSRIKTPSAILSADWHLRDDTPLCRLDNYWEAQSRKVAFIRELQEKHGCPVLIAGDLFHKAKPGEHLLQWTINNLPENVIVVPGQHDIPNHNMGLYERSGLAVLEAARKIIVLKNSSLLNSTWTMTIHGYPYGTELKDYQADIIMIHEMVLAGKMFPGAVGYTPDELREIFPNASLVLAGDNHKPNCDTNLKPIVLNPGSLMRMTADQADYQPAVWLWYAEENRVEPVNIPIQSDIISREHIDTPAERDTRMEAFVDRLRNDIEIGLSFKSNLTAYMNKNNIDKDVQKVVWEAVG